MGNSLDGLEFQKLLGFLRSIFDPIMILLPVFDISTWHFLGGLYDPE